MAEIDICMYKLTKAGFPPGKNLGRGVSVGWADFMNILIILVITLSKHEYNYTSNRMHEQKNFNFEKHVFW